jgi:hypothetical protein
VLSLWIWEVSVIRLCRGAEKNQELMLRQTMKADLSEQHPKTNLTASAGRLEITVILQVIL